MATILKSSLPCACELKKPSVDEECLMVEVVGACSLALLDIQD